MVFPALELTAVPFSVLGDLQNLKKVESVLKNIQKVQVAILDHCTLQVKTENPALVKSPDSSTKRPSIPSSVPELG